MLPRYRKTKIIATIGPKTASYDMLKKLHEAGMDILRLNMSHGNREFHEKILRWVKNLSRERGFPIPVLLDTQGPEIRTAELKEALSLKEGDVIEVSPYPEGIEEKSTIVVNYEAILEDLKEGDRISVDNGLILLEVLEVSPRSLKCKVLEGGEVKSRRHVNLPGIRLRKATLTEKDKEDIALGVKYDVDFIALSFTRTKEDVEEAREYVRSLGGKAEIIAKIEDPEGMKNLKEIVESSYGVMVARGDLGIEVPIEELPILQRKIVKECAYQGKRVIIATHLLESMIQNPFPTRAEVTDTANAVYEEADALMLSGETTVGKYPIKCIEILDRIAKRVEKSGGIRWAREREAISLKEKMAKYAVELADSLKAEGIVVITRRGIMAEHVASFHPHYSPIFAFTNSPLVRRRLILIRGVFSYRIDFSDDPEKTLQNAFDLLLRRNLLKKGDLLVIISDVLAGEKKVDAIQVRRLEG